MKLFLLIPAALLTIAGCSSQPELLCSGDNVKDLTNQILKNLILGKNTQVKNESEPNWEYIFPSYKIELKNIRLTSKNKEMNQITCEADVESNVFDIKKLTVDMVNSLKVVKDYLEKKEPNNHEASEGIYMISTQLKVIGMNHADRGNIYPIKYEVQLTEDKKSIYLKFKSNIPRNLIETLNALSETSYNLRISEDKMKK